MCSGAISELGHIDLEQRPCKPSTTRLRLGCHLILSTFSAGQLKLTRAARVYTATQMGSEA
jgi:hypothetical protein